MVVLIVEAMDEKVRINERKKWRWKGDQKYNNGREIEITIDLYHGEGSGDTVVDKRSVAGVVIKAHHCKKKRTTR